MDLHIKGMKMLGADIKLEHLYCRTSPKLVGASIYLGFSKCRGYGKHYACSFFGRGCHCS